MSRADARAERRPRRRSPRKIGGPLHGNGSSHADPRALAAGAAAASGLTFSSAVMIGAPLRCGVTPRGQRAWHDIGLGRIALEPILPRIAPRRALTGVASAIATRPPQRALVYLARIVLAPLVPHRRAGPVAHGASA
ncbi:MAG: hypothetical protein HS111_23735 [Kofleriaceae bacterium]|nr:hypothetical protein [Kofleriaceae bacterium]